MMKKVAEDCEYFDTGQCKALVSEGAIVRDESCLNQNKSSCCYRCSRRDSCDVSCDHLDGLKTDSDLETEDSLKDAAVKEARTLESGESGCPKCGGEMLAGSASSSFRILKDGDLTGDYVLILYCRECGYVEFYKEPSTKEPWRLQKGNPKEEGPKPEQVQSEGEIPDKSTRRKMIR